MKNTSFNITVPHSFLPISVFRRNSRSPVVPRHFKFHETLQINQSNSLIKIMLVLKFYNSFSD